MKINLYKLKRKYNEVLTIEKKAEDFFNNPVESMERKERWLPKFNMLLRRLSLLQKAYEELTGAPMTEEELFNGFKFSI